MSQGIMICDIALYRDLTKVNINAFLASKLNWVDSIAKLELMLSLDQTYEFIISLAALGNKDIVAQVIKIKEKFLPKAPVVFIGHCPQNGENVGSVPSPYHQAAIIKFIMNANKWNPTDFMNKKVDNYIPIPISLVQFATHAAEDIYLKPVLAVEEYILAAKKGEALEEMPKVWLKEEIVNVYFSSQNRLAAITEITKCAALASDDALKSNDDKLQKNALNQNTGILREVFSDVEQYEKLSAVAKQEIGNLAKKTEALVGKIITRINASANPTLNNLLSGFKSNDQSFIPQLSYLSMFVTLQMIKSETWFNETVEEKIRYIHLFNNISLLPLYKKYPDFPNTQNIVKNLAQMTPKEQELYNWHPKVSSNLVASLPGIPLGLDQFIMQHHGTLSGQYLENVASDELSVIAKYCFVAELFAEMMLASHEEINELQKNAIIQKIKEKFPNKSYIKIIANLEKIQI